MPLKPLVDTAPDIPAVEQAGAVVRLACHAGAVGPSKRCRYQLFTIDGRRGIEVELAPEVGPAASFTIPAYAHSDCMHMISVYEEGEYVTALVDSAGSGEGTVLTLDCPVLLPDGWWS